MTLSIHYFEDGFILAGDVQESGIAKIFDLAISRAVLHGLLFHMPAYQLYPASAAPLPCSGPSVQYSPHSRYRLHTSNSYSAAFVPPVGAPAPSAEGTGGSWNREWQ
jgi:hypothetical protein